MLDEQKKRVLNDFLSFIEGISDIEYQKRVWIRGEGPEVDDFDETVCCFFDREFIIKNYKNYGVTDSQYVLLVTFRDEFQQFCDTHYHPLEFMDSPEWKKIRERAKEVLDAFHYKKDYI